MTKCRHGCSPNVCLDCKLDNGKVQAAILGQFSLEETDPNGTAPWESGCKLDAGKPIAGEIVTSFPRAMRAIVSVATFGAIKYTRRGFLSVPNADERYMDAAIRHILAHGVGENRDKDSGLPHLWHALWNLAAIVEIGERNKENISRQAAIDDLQG